MQWSDGNGLNQQFSVADSSDGHVRLINRNSGKALEVQNSSTADGGNIVQYTDYNGANQQWQLVPVGGGSTPPAGGTFTNRSSGRTSRTATSSGSRRLLLLRLHDALLPGRARAALLRPGQLGVRGTLGAPPRLRLRRLRPVRWPRLRQGHLASAFNYRPANSTYYWLGCTEFNRTYVYTSASAGSGWSKKARINKCYYDAGLLFDNDTPYVAYATARSASRSSTPT